MLSSQLKAGFDAAMAQQTAKRYARRKSHAREAGKMQLESMERMLTETENVVFGWASTSLARRRLWILGPTLRRALARTKMSPAMQGLTSQFVGFEQFESATNFRYTTRVNPEDADSFASTIKGMFDQGLKQATDAAKGKLPVSNSSRSFPMAQLELITATLKEGVLDGGLIVRTRMVCNWFPVPA